jgi:hypothetical protein
MDELKRTFAVLQIEKHPGLYKDSLQGVHSFLHVCVCFFRIWLLLHTQVHEHMFQCASTCRELQALGNAGAVSLLAMATPNDMRISAEHIAMADQFIEVPGGSNNNNYANVSAGSMPGDCGSSCVVHWHPLLGFMGSFLDSLLL